MAQILEQWKRYFEWMHYNIALKKQFDVLVKQGQERRKKLTEKFNEVEELKLKTEILIKEEGTYIATLKHINDVNKSKNIKLITYKRKINIFKQLFENVKESIYKTDGYIFYINHAKNLTILRIKNIEDIMKIRDKEKYAIHMKMFHYKNRASYLILYPYTITLSVKGAELFYDPESFDNYVDKVTKVNMTNIPSGKMDIGSFIKQNLLLIIAIVVIFILFFTPEGKHFLANILPK